MVDPSNQWNNSELKMSAKEMYMIIEERTNEQTKVCFALYIYFCLSLSLAMHTPEIQYNDE